MTLEGYDVLPHICRRCGMTSCLPDTESHARFKAVVIWARILPQTPKSRGRSPNFYTQILSTQEPDWDGNTGFRAADPNEQYSLRSGLTFHQVCQSSHKTRPLLSSFLRTTPPPRQLDCLYGRRATYTYSGHRTPAAQHTRPRIWISATRPRQVRTLLTVLVAASGNQGLRARNHTP